MKNIPKQAKREERIAFEIVVDAYDESERAMGWYYYLQDKLRVPFKAKCKSVRSTSPLKVGIEVEVVDLASEDDCMSEIFVVVNYGKSKLAVPLEQIECHSTNDETCQAVSDWHYWVARGHEF